MSDPQGVVTVDTQTLAALDAYVEHYRHRLMMPGVVLAIVADGRLVHTRGIGHARPGGGPPTAHTPFYIGSLTKSLTALGVMQLVEAGKIELDAAVQRYLPWSGWQTCRPQPKLRCGTC